MAQWIKLCETNRFPGERKCEIFRKLGCILCTADKVLLKECLRMSKRMQKKEKENAIYLV